MCRFLLAKSNQPLPVTKLLDDFTSMAQQSRTADGDLQADGYGVTWWHAGAWHTHRSLKPIWQDPGSIPPLPSTHHLLLHARSASFPDQIGRLDFNQPFTHDNFAFVFNGQIQGVKLNRPIPGRIGAQKLFNLFLEHAATLPPDQALIKLHHLISTHSRQIVGFNLGLSDGQHLYAFSDYSQQPDYFTLHSVQTDNIDLICSQPLPGFDWQPIKKQTMIKL